MIRNSPLTSWNKETKIPNISDQAYVDRASVLIGDVTVERRAIVLPGAVLRADEGGPIIIGEGSNVQDGVIMHCLKGSSVLVGPNCSIAHGAVVHGPCQIEEGSFVGFNAVLLKCSVGPGCFISHGAQVLNVNIPQGLYVPPGTIVDSADKVMGLEPVTVEQREFAQAVIRVNDELRQGYKRLVVLSGSGDQAEPDGYGCTFKTIRKID